MTLDIYYSTLSSPSLAVRVFVEVAGIPHKLHSISLGAEENRGSDYLKLNPLGIVPYMKDGDFGQGESGAIMTYLAETRTHVADHWYPKEDPKARARVLAAMLWHGSTLRSGSASLFDHRVLGPIIEGRPESADAVNLQCLPTLQRALKDIDSVFLHDGQFVAGDEISVADLLLAVEVESLRAQDATSGPGYDDLLADHSRLRAWMERVASRCEPHYDRALRSMRAMAVELAKKRDDPAYEPDFVTIEGLSES